ncbi:MAG: repressor LexA [Bdellovibrionaceae bacterium]|nr:repressor LexA [Pseudobdellovibrionaceae bacterium]|tara:strand:+ start:4539 stop:5177 length:639 start_codon:yes stop_codon:yes gene_type:complete
MAPALTPKQKDVLQFIQKFDQENGYAPSQAEIAKHFGFKSLGTVQNYLVRLERHGFLKKTLNARRGMEVVDPRPTPTSTAEAVPLPLVGRVAAGYPIEAVEVADTIDVPATLLKKKGEHFVLKVAGDSMIEDGILDGDFVVIKKQEEAKNGETIVALINNEATIKRYQNKDSKIRLLPANSQYEPIVIDQMRDPLHFKIEGILVGLIRDLSN